MKEVQCENCRSHRLEVSGKCNLCGEDLSNVIPSTHGKDRPPLAIWERSIGFKLRLISAFWFSAAACLPIISPYSETPQYKEMIDQLPLDKLDKVEELLSGLSSAEN